MLAEGIVTINEKKKSCVPTHSLYLIHVISPKFKLSCQNEVQLIRSVIKQTSRQDNINKREKMSIQRGGQCAEYYKRGNITHR